MTCVRRVAAVAFFLSLGAFVTTSGQERNRPSGNGDGQRKVERQARDREQARPAGQVGRRGDRDEGDRGADRTGRGSQRTRPRSYEGPEQPSDSSRPREGGQGVYHRPTPREYGPGWGGANRQGYPRWQRSEQQARLWQQRRGWAGRDSWQGRNSWEEHRARRWRLEHRTWRQRGGYGGYFVPPDRWHGTFGRRNWFHISTRPMIVEGFPRFYHGGYWWMIVDPWPEFWADDWYDADDLCIDYSDGYYLHNRRHPGVELAVAVVF